MQVKKEDIKEKIISSARREFLEHGYAEASLRVIAERAGLTKGAVYSYFENKNALFCELTDPAVSFIENEFNHDAYRDTLQGEDDLWGSYTASVQGFRNHAHAVLDHHESFRLLLFCAAGSSLQDYKERMIRLYARNFHMRLSLVPEAENRKGISEMFIHTLASTYVSFLEELVLHEPDRTEAEEYAVQMAIFIRSGIEKLYLHQMG